MVFYCELHTAFDILCVVVIRDLENTEYPADVVEDRRVRLAHSHSRQESNLSASELKSRMTQRFAAYSDRIV